MIKRAIAVLAFMTFGAWIGRFTVQPPVARAQGGCTVASLKGAYGLAINGFYYDANGFQGFYSSAGLAVADGNGSITGTDTVNLDGTPTRGRKFTGTYTVNSDCTGATSLKDASGNVLANLDLVITNGGKDVALVDYDTDTILSGTAKLQ
jgi:hypothetical protein